MAAGYKDFTAGAVLTAADLEDYCQNQATMRFASAAARDSALSAVLTEGLRAYLIDANCECLYTGAAWSTIGPVHGAPLAWTPAVVQSGAVATTNNNSTYTRVGRAITARFYVTATGSGTAANFVNMSLPVTADTTAGSVGTWVFRDSSTALNYAGVCRLNSTTSCLFMLTSIGMADGNQHMGVNPLGGGWALAMASGDELSGELAYTAAADA